MPVPETPWTSLNHLPLSDEVRRHFDALCAALFAQRHIPPAVLALCHRRIAQLHRLDLQSIPEAVRVDALKLANVSDWHRHPAFSEAERACLAFTEVYLADAQAITDDLAGAVKAQFGEPGLVALIEALGLLDGSVRTDLLWGSGSVCSGDVASSALKEAAPSPGKASVARVGPSGQATGSMLRDSALGQVPETIDHLAALGQALWSSGPLGPAELEVARLRNARRVNCVFCKSVRYDIALADGLTEERIAQIDNDYADSGLSERDKLIIAYVDCFYTSPGPVSTPLAARLYKHFSEAERAHLALALLYFSSFSRCAVALGGMPDALPLMEISVPT